MSRVLLLSDLDRTLIPNGPQPESPEARPLLRRLVRRPELALAYVSGRHLQLLQEAVRLYDLPTPDYAIGDVGTTIYEVVDGQWRRWRHWDQAIAPDWAGLSRAQLAALLEGIDGLRLQEPEKQNDYKLSYYAPPDLDRNRVLTEAGARLERAGVKARLIWSVDETTHTGLLDVLPRSASKLHAIEFLIKEAGFDPRRTVFAGDSGNDLPVLTSGIQSVLVANATDEVREQALREAAAAGHGGTLYLARGGFLGMNGNYAAGALEGLAHFIPEVAGWLGGGETV